MMRLLVALLAFTVVLLAQDKNPLHGNKDAIEAGRGQFRIYCGPCHGIAAQGGRGPDLTTGSYASGNADEQVFKTISDGIAGTEMAAYGDRFDTDGIWRMVSYLRSVSGKPAPNLKGDRANGEKLFWGRGGCGACHRVGERGSRMGPELTKVGRQRSVGYIRESIVAPNASLTPGYNTVRIVLHDGRTLAGVQKGFDAFSAQIMDMQERYHSYLREEVRSISREYKSMMPGNYSRLFSEQEVTDMVLYMANLRGDGAAVPARLPAGPIGNDRLQQAQRENNSWLMYGKNFGAWRYADLSQIDTSNVAKLTPVWTFQTGVNGKNETTPIVDTGLMYITGPSNHAWALDLKTGRPYWHYSKIVPSGVNACCGQVNRGFAALGDRLFKVNMEASLVALDAKTGQKIWETTIDDFKRGYSATVAPLAVKNLIVVGIAGAEFGIRGFIDAYDADTGKRVWRFWTVPAPGEPGSNTWGGESWKQGGGSTWITGSYDPELDTIYWGTGNPGPDFNGDVRPGDNLYTCALVALDANTGKLKWHYQFTPHDVHDWDATSDPVLLDIGHEGKRVKAVVMANRNGYYYALDRSSGKLLTAKAYTQVSWADGINMTTGKPNVIPGQDPTEQGNRSCPTIGGGHNWQATTYSPKADLYYFNTTDGCQLYFKYGQEYVDGLWYQASTVAPIPEEPSSGSIVALKPNSGDVAWKFELTSGPSSGLLSTAGGLVFGGDREGYLFALDAATGKALWRHQTGGVIIAPPITYDFGGRQYIAVAAGSSIVTFALSK
ncbi:MAG: PQQ-dependent dehydrogenase, methanol/ethanol family [Bryobacterales bacterium]|nr:PQQ-dependent dehydrogenase, methanol/ethanol family [Bryobacterales bacterium]